jgi:hypothetical protein
LARRDAAGRYLSLAREGSVSAILSVLAGLT